MTTDTPSDKYDGDERGFRFHMRIVALVSTRKHLAERHGVTDLPEEKRDLHILHAAQHGRDWFAYARPSEASR